MDARDSTSQSAISSSTAGGKDDTAISTAAALAKAAALHYQSCRFAECLDILHQLALTKGNDPKICHNIAITEYFQDGCSDPRQLLKVLNDVKSKEEESAQAYKEQGEAISNLGNKAIPGSKGSGMIAQFSAANNPSLLYMDELDPAVATLNIAIIWFHLQEYKLALSVLEPLFHNIEPMDEATALHVCLLLLDVALACQEACKSAEVLIYLEKSFGIGCLSQADSGGTALQQSSNLNAKSSAPNNSSATDSGSYSAPSGSSFENSLLRSLSLSEDTLDAETMFTLDMSGQNLARPAGLSSSDDSSRTPFDRSLSTVDLKFKLQLYKVRFLLLTRNLKQAKREVKLAMNIARGRDSSMALLLKSQLESARGNYHKAIKLLMASSGGQTEIGISSMYNNLGCIYYQLGKYHTSSVLFSKALDGSSSLQKDKPLKLSMSSQDKSLFIMYNSGMQHLACGKPLLAARCFQKASLVFYNRPILWLRLAECCLMALEKGLLKYGQHQSESTDILVHVIGKGKWRYLAICDETLKNGCSDSGKRNNVFFGCNGQGMLSLSLARQFLLNGLLLLESYESKHSDLNLASNFSFEENEECEAGSVKQSNYKNFSGFDSKVSVVSASSDHVYSNGDSQEPKVVTVQEVLQNSISYFEDVRRRENHMIKQALLANLAYVELELDNPEKALSLAKSLLELPECSRTYCFLGHAYAAEALCLLDRLKEAAEHLSVYLSGESNVDFPLSQEDCEQWQVERTHNCEEQNGVAANNSCPEESHPIVFLKPEEAQGILYADFANLYALQGELEQAHKFVTLALSFLPDSREITLTAIYIDLMLGQSQSAIAKLKQCNQVRFFQAGEQSSVS